MKMCVSLEFAVKEVLLAVAGDPGLTRTSINIARDSRLDQDLGMDEVDPMEVICRLEDRFAVKFPDDQIQPWSTVADLVNCLAKRLSEIEGVEGRPCFADQPNSLSIGSDPRNPPPYR